MTNTITEKIVQILFIYNRHDGAYSYSESQTWPDDTPRATQVRNELYVAIRSERDLHSSLGKMKETFTSTDFDDGHSVCLLDGEMCDCNEKIYKWYGEGYYIVDYTQQSSVPIKVTEIAYKARIDELDSIIDNASL